VLVRSDAGKPRPFFRSAPLFFFFFFQERVVEGFLPFFFPPSSLSFLLSRRWTKIMEPTLPRIDGLSFFPPFLPFFFLEGEWRRAEFNIPPPFFYRALFFFFFFAAGWAADGEPGWPSSLFPPSPFFFFFLEAKDAEKVKGDRAGFSFSGRPVPFSLFFPRGSEINGKLRIAFFFPQGWRLSS